MTQEDETDDRVEAAADVHVVEQLGEPAVADVVVDQDERERADPRALDPGEAADHRHDEQVDRRRQADVARGDLALPPDEQDAGERREERGEAEGERPVQRDGVAERAHPHRLVADALQAEPERRPDDEPDQGVHDERHPEARCSRGGSGR